MTFRFETLDSFKIAGVSTPITDDMESNFREIPKFWAKTSSDGTLDRLAPLMDTSSPILGALGLTAHTPATDLYYIGVAVSPNADTKGFDEYAVPSSQWVVFSGEGEIPKDLSKLYEHIFTEWIPNAQTHGYEYLSTLDMEVYKTPDPTNSVFEIWLQVRKAY